jgi:hypothetical protein
VAYRADIEIAVRGAQELKRLQNEISATSKLIVGLNNYIENIGSGGVVRNISNLQDTVQKAANAFSQAALNTDEAVIAAKKYIDATNDLNAGLRERQLLLKGINDEERKSRLAAIGREVGGRPSAGYAGPIGPGAASAVGALVGQQSPVAERIQRTIKGRQDEIALQQALLRLEEKSAAELNKKVQSQEALVQGTREVLALVDQQNKRQQFLTGKSGTAIQGPLAGPGAMGFPVALPLSAAEQKGLETETKKQQILQRMVATRQQLVGLASNLQRLDQNSAVAIADARRAQETLNLAKERELQITREVAAIRNKENAASIAARQRLATEANRRQLVQNAGFGLQGPVLPPTAAQKGARTGSGIGGRLGGAISGSIIGGAFPLLFGQGGGASAGGAIGGLVGGLAGPGGSFAGSLLGTLLGDIASRGQAVQQLGEDLGFSAAQAKTLADAFKTANTDVEKFTAVIQNIRGVGLELEEQATAVQLVTALTEKYGGSFEKVGNAVTSALESGKVSQAVLNQLTNQGITVQDALAAKYDVSRDKILEMAKKGEISVQSLLDTLVELGNASTKAAEKTQTPFEKALSTTGTLFQSFWKDVQMIFAGISSNGVDAATKLLNVFNTLLKEVLFPLGRLLARIAALFIDVVSTGVRAAAELITSFRGVASAIGDAVMNVINMIPGLRTIVGLARQLIKGITGPKSSDWNDMPWPQGIPKPGSAGMIGSITAPSQAAPSGGAGAKGPKPPEDRTAQLREDLEAMKLISTTQDGIRDALFEGNKELAIRLAYDQKIADIDRDTAKALLNANYESEKLVIRAQEIVRIKDAQQERDDQLRELARDINETITDTLDDLRGGISWDDTGLREIFDMRIPDAIDEVQQSIKDLTDPTNQVIGAATAIGDAFANSFRGIVSGAVSAREGLADFFRSVGDYFIDMAARIAAEALKLQAIKLVQNLLNPLGFAASSMTLPGLEGAGALSNGRLFEGGAFAEGGFVTGPTRALIGEGGEPEYVIPASKMRSAMGRYSAGARGSSVISAGGDPGEMSGAATMAPAAIDVRYSIERINNVDYVTADQFQAGMAQAAQQGAIQGERRAMRTLTNSAAARGRLRI